MKKIISLIIASLILFSNFSISNANNENYELFYGKITGVLTENKERTIFLLEKKYGEIDQIFSINLAKRIDWLYHNSNDVVVEGKKYFSKKDGKYMGIFVENIWTKEQYKKLHPKKIVKKVIKKLTEKEKIKAYIFVKNKMAKGAELSEALYFVEKYFGKEKGAREAFYEISLKLNGNGAIFLTNIFKEKMDICEIKNGKRLFENQSIDFQNKIKSIEVNELNKIINGENKEGENLYIFNELNGKNEIIDYLKNEKQLQIFENIGFNQLEKNELLSFSSFSKEENEEKKIEKIIKLGDFLDKKIIDTKNKNAIKIAIKNEVNKSKFCNNSVYEGVEFQSFLEELKKDKKKEFVKNNFSKTFEEKELDLLKVNIPNNFQISKIKYENMELNKIYFPETYYSDLILNINFVEKFQNYNCEEKIILKISGIFGEKLKCGEKIIYKIENNGKKIEIFYSNLSEDYAYIFEKIIKTIIIK